MRYKAVVGALVKVLSSQLLLPIGFLCPDEWIQRFQVRYCIEFQVRYSLWRGEGRNFLFWKESGRTGSHPYVICVRRQGFWLCLLGTYIADNAHSNLNLCRSGMDNMIEHMLSFMALHPWAQDGWEEFVKVRRFLTDAAIWYSILMAFLSLNPGSRF